MSFSSDTKSELMGVVGGARHCLIAELAAIVHFAGKSEKSGDLFDIVVENEYASQKYFTLLEKTFNINSINRTVAEALKLREDSKTPGEIDPVADARILGRDCCKRAYLRGAFLGAGYVSDPKSEYHLEYACRNRLQAAQLMDIMSSYGVEHHPILRKKTVSVYIKEGESVVNLLGLMGASVSLMNMENARILKEIGNNINRQVNCETANIAKTVNAAARQVADIEYIRDEHGLDILPGKLRQIAALRLENPEMTLMELGELLEPAVGKSGVNHRLRKISEIAEELRKTGERN